MRIKPSTYFVLFVLLLVMAIIGMSLRFPYLEAKLLPLLLGSVVILLVAVQLRSELGKGKAEAIAEQTPQQMVTAREMTQRFSSTLGWIVGFIISVWVLGFFVSVPLFAVSYLKLRGRNWRTSVSFAVIAAAFVYGVFELGLKAHLYPGLIFGGR